MVKKSKVYYIPFVENMKKIDLYLLFSLYDLAEYNEETKIYDTIKYSSQNSLALQLGISYNTVKRLLSNKDYSIYFQVDTKNKTIKLNNDFRNSNSQKVKQPFVSVSAEEIRILRQNCIGNELLPKYYLYIKYYCGYNKNSHYTDSTAKQILSAIGYSNNSSYVSLLPRYNKLLTDCGLMRIDTYRDELGHLRNKYSIKI